MKGKLFLLIAALVLTIGSNQYVLSQGRALIASVGINRIEGRIFDEGRRPVDNAFVELYNDIGALVDRQRSVGQGRFSFKGMPQGRYTVVVKPYGTNLLEQSQDIEVNNQNAAIDTVIVDFRLKVDRRFQSDTPTVVGTVYAQDVPDNVRRIYRSAVENIDTDRNKALAGLEEAVNLFPTYFDALAALGKAHVMNGNYEKGYPYLLRAIDVNVKCGDCFYSLALAFYQLRQIPASVKAADAAVTLLPLSPTARLLQGMAHNSNGTYKEAESALRVAKELFKGSNPDVFYQLALVLNKLDRNQEAADELELFLKAGPKISNAEVKKIKSLIADLRKTKTSE